MGRVIGGRVSIRGGGVRGSHNRGRGGNRRVRVSDESSLLDHDINRGFTMEEAHQRVQPSQQAHSVINCANLS